MSIQTRNRALTIVGFIALSSGFFACAQKGVPNPRSASAAYVEAVRKGDADALYALLNAESRRAVTREEVRVMLTDSKSELLQRAEALSEHNTAVEAQAAVGFADGETVRLLLEDGQYRIRAAGSLPSGARTPVDALAELRGVLSRRSYAGVIRVLSSDSRSALEKQLGDLVQALEQPETLRIDLDDDTATVDAPGGHRIVLRRENGVWKVHDFK